MKKNISSYLVPKPLCKIIFFFQIEYFVFQILNTLNFITIVPYNMPSSASTDVVS